MNAEETRKMILTIAQRLLENEKRLCELDSVVGDGDHGATVARGFREVINKLEEGQYQYPAQVLNVAGHVLAISMGGAIGPLLGSFFQTGAGSWNRRMNWDFWNLK